MKKEGDQKHRFMQRVLQAVRKAAENGAGRPSHKGLFEPEVPESAKKSGGVSKYEIKDNLLQVYAMIFTIFVAGIRYSFYTLL